MKSIKHSPVLKTDIISVHFPPDSRKTHNTGLKHGGVVAMNAQSNDVIIFVLTFMTYKQGEGFLNHLLEVCQQ